MIKKILFSIAFIGTSLISHLHAWWDSGHMVITKIAEENMSEKAKENVDDLINYLPEAFEKSNSLLTASVWADDVASNGFTGWSWHGKSMPYDPDHILSKEQKDIINAKIEDNNGIIGINLAIKTLKNPQASKLEKAIMLRFLLHDVGDLHMPLHCCSLYSNEFLDGDKGGGKFKLDIDLNGKNSLHSLWDSCLLRDYERQDRPLNDHGEKYIQEFYEDVMTTIPKQTLQDIDNMDFDLWAQESHEIGINHAYKNIEQNSKPSDEYINENRKIAYKRLALAGYRLANIINEIYE